MKPNVKLHSELKLITISMAIRKVLNKNILDLSNYLLILGYFESRNGHNLNIKKLIYNRSYLQMFNFFIKN